MKKTGPVVGASSPPVLRDHRGRIQPGSGRLTRGRVGAPIGNTNGVRQGWRSFWRRRALRPEDRWIEPILRDYSGALVADRGGPDAMSGAEAHLIQIAQLARGCTMLILAEAATKGGLLAVRRSAAVKDGGAVRSVSDPDLAGALARFMSIEVAALRALGLKRVAPPALSLTAYLEARQVAAGRAVASETDAEPSAPVIVAPEDEER